VFYTTYYLITTGEEKWRSIMIIVPPYREDEMAPVRIVNDHSFFGSQYRADPKFAASLQQNMVKPSYKIRAF
jgi:hypothetical protein